AEVLQHLPESEFQEATFLPVTYCEPGNDGTIDPNVLQFLATNEEPVTHIFITDICPSEEVIAKLAAYCDERKIQWTIFDHHISSVGMNALFPSHSKITVADERTGLK